MKKLFLSLLMPLAVFVASAQNNDYNMVIELNNGTKVTLGANEVDNLTFSNGAISIDGNTIEDIYEKIANKANKSEFEGLREQVKLLQDNVERLNKGYLIPSFEGTYTVNGVSFKMIKVKGGVFQMGSSTQEADQQPVHSVTLSDYCIGETEVTQALWYAVMGQKPKSNGDKWSSTYGLGDNYPAYFLSWNDCQEFIKKLNELTGKTFSLPTEAEWEYAARGGNKSKGYKYSGSNNVLNVAWSSDNSNGSTHPVATKTPNELGVYDMSGNVWEWCSDWYGSYKSSAQTNPTGASEGSHRVERGGSWSSTTGEFQTTTYRGYNTPITTGKSHGMRLVLK